MALVLGLLWGFSVPIGMRFLEVAHSFERDPAADRIDLPSFGTQPSSEKDAHFYIGLNGTTTILILSVTDSVWVLIGLTLLTCCMNWLLNGLLDGLIGSTLLTY